MKVKEAMTEMKLKTMPGDEALYYNNEKGELRGAVLSHVDDFSLAGDDDFVDEIVKGVSERFTVSKVEKRKFRYTGLDVESRGKEVELSMEDYAKSLDEVKEISKSRQG